MKRPTHGIAPTLALALALGCSRQGPSPLLTLRRVVLNQSGSGYFERTGRVEGDRLALRLKSHEVNDVLATLTVLEQGDRARQTVVAAGVPHATTSGGERNEAVELDLRLPDPRARDLLVAYAVPTANWQATYRVVLPDREGGPALLQVWALVHNSSDEDWNSVEMTLATGAPLSFAFNLRTPSFTARPDATGRLTTPVVNGPVTSEVARNLEDRRRAREPDTGGATHAVDEPLDGSYASRQGVAGGDSDRDGIPDANDRCPNETETFNGAQDDDGCPDHGTVRVEASMLRILERVSFTEGSSALAPAQQPVLDAVAATLRANPQIRVIEVQGNATPEEPNAWPLALDRAATVRARLVALGVASDRLRVRSFGASRPVAPNESPQSRARNRTVSFEVIADANRAPGGDDIPVSGRAAVTVSSLRASAAENASAHEYLGATRFVVSAPVSVRAGSAALVTIASREVPGEDVYLFRPESVAPASREHPYRAARLRNRTGTTLLPGPVALFSGGTFAGEGLLERLHDDETTFIPYAIDPSTTVAVTTEDAREPARIVSVIRHTITLEDTSVHRTRYTITPGAQAPPRLFLRHGHLAGYTPRNLPPESEQGREADLVPVALTARRESAVTLEQTTPTRRELSLIDDITTDLAPYLQTATDPVRQQLRAALELRNGLARAEREADEIREALADVSARNAELRETLRTLQAVTDAARVELRTRLTRQLQESMTRHESLSRDLATRTAHASALRTSLIDALRGLRIEAAP
jgi:outer membrane protein OmpA-like peptidoglycan-associated protein